MHVKRLRLISLIAVHVHVLEFHTIKKRRSFEQNIFNLLDPVTTCVMSEFYEF